MGKDVFCQAAWEPASDEELQAAFRAFACFGAGGGGTPKSATPKAAELDGARFAKLVCGFPYLLAKHRFPISRSGALPAAGCA